MKKQIGNGLKRHDLFNRVGNIKCCNFSYSCPFMYKVIIVVIIDTTIGRKKFLTKKTIQD